MENTKNLNDYIIILNEEDDLIYNYKFENIKYNLTFNELVRYILNDLIFLIKDKKEFKNIKLIIIKYSSYKLLLKKINYENNKIDFNLKYYMIEHERYDYSFTYNFTFELLDELFIENKNNLSLSINHNNLGNIIFPYITEMSNKKFTNNLNKLKEGDLYKCIIEGIDKLVDDNIKHNQIEIQHFIQYGK